MYRLLSMLEHKNMKILLVTQDRNKRIGYTLKEYAKPVAPEIKKVRNSDPSQNSPNGTFNATVYFGFRSSSCRNEKLL